jgi:hypothetical protein
MQHQIIQQVSSLWEGYQYVSMTLSTSYGGEWDVYLVHPKFLVVARVLTVGAKHSANAVQTNLIGLQGIPSLSAQDIEEAVKILKPLPYYPSADSYTICKSLGAGEVIVFSSAYHGILTVNHGFKTMTLWHPQTHAPLYKVAMPKDDAGSVDWQGIVKKLTTEKVYKHLSYVEVVDQCHFGRGNGDIHYVTVTIDYGHVMCAVSWNSEYNALNFENKAIIYAMLACHAMSYDMGIILSPHTLINSECVYWTNESEPKFAKYYDRNGEKTEPAW